MKRRVGLFVTVPRLLAALALAATLAAIPATRPEDAAAAVSMSQGTARWLCSHAGGSISNYEEPDSGYSDMACTLPSGEQYFICEGAEYLAWMSCY
jgi:hypothetical protein